MPKPAPPLPPLSVRPHPHLLEIPTWTWLEELSLRQGWPLRLGQVPDVEWNRLQELGFDLIWLMGIWRRSPGARQVFRTDATRFPQYDQALPGWKLSEIVGSPYAVQDYRPDPRIGTWGDVDRVRRKLRERGMGLILDFVPNHTALDHPWVKTHPEYFITGTEDDFRRDPALFSLREERDGKLRCVARGRDPFFPAWPDTAQLNHFHPATRQALVDVVRRIARHADGLRCDMAMLALNNVFARIWNALDPGAPPATEFWQEAIAAAPELLWLAEAYWDTEPRLQQLGFQFTYDKPFYDFLRAGSAPDLRRRLAADFHCQRRLARFLENHDEQRAAAVFGPERMQAAATLAATAPGLRFYFHGQIDGRKIHLPIELGRAPEEPGNAAIREIYEKLLRLGREDVFHTGRWTLLEAAPVGDASHENLVAFEWRSADAWKLVVANPSGQTAQGRVAVGDGVDGSTRYLLRDELNDVDYPRAGQELASGLFIRLEPGRAHLFDIRPGE